MELNKIYCCDNIKGFNEYIDPCSIDMVITSPPYGQLRDYKGYSWDSDALILRILKSLKQGGVCVWIEGDSVVNGSETGLPFKHALNFISKGFNLHDTMIYKKKGMSFPDFNRYYNCFEYMFIFSIGKPKTFNAIKDKKNIWFGDSRAFRSERQKTGECKRKLRQATKEYSVRQNIWEYDVGFLKTTKDNIAYEHPAIYPEELVKDHIISWSNENDIILDPFMGSGTTAKIAYLLKRNYIGFEISQEYVDLANKRLEPYLIQQSLF